MLISSILFRNIIAQFVSELGWGFTFQPLEYSGHGCQFTESSFQCKLCHCHISSFLQFCLHEVNSQHIDPGIEIDLIDVIDITGEKTGTDAHLGGCRAQGYTILEIRFVVPSAPDPYNILYISSVGGIVGFSRSRSDNRTGCIFVYQRFDSDMEGENAGDASIYVTCKFRTTMAKDMYNMVFTHMSAISTAGLEAIKSKDARPM